MEASESSVTKEDQDNINRFNRLHTRVKDLELQLTAKKSELEGIEDASNEVVLADEDDLRFLVGQCFLHVGTTEAEEKVQAAMEEATAERDKLQEDISKHKEEIAGIKKVLYGRLGNSINLEE